MYVYVITDVLFHKYYSLYILLKTVEIEKVGITSMRYLWHTACDMKILYWFDIVIAFLTKDVLFRQGYTLCNSICGIYRVT